MKLIKLISCCLFWSFAPCCCPGLKRPGAVWPQGSSRVQLFVLAWLSLRPAALCSSYFHPGVGTLSSSGTQIKGSNPEHEQVALIRGVIGLTSEPQEVLQEANRTGGSNESSLRTSSQIINKFIKFSLTHSPKHKMFVFYETFCPICSFFFTRSKNK